VEHDARLVDARDLAAPHREAGGYKLDAFNGLHLAVEHPLSWPKMHIHLRASNDV
jgi:hypothetical protein